MNYTKFKKDPIIELKLLSALEILTEKRLAFKIDNCPNYDISHYDRHRMETYFFSDSHPFPYNMSFIIHVNKESETLLSIDDIKDYQKEFEIDDHIEEDEEVLSQALANNCDIDLWIDDVDGFELHGIQQPIIDNTGKTITFIGGYKADYSGIQPEWWSIYAICDVLGLSAWPLEDKFHLGILAEGLAMMLRKEYKLASFMFFCSMESFINFKLNSESDAERLSEKLKKLIANTFPTIELRKHPIYTAAINEFDKLSGLRNAIAHGTKAVSVSRQDSRSHLILVLTLIACIEKAHADFSSLHAALQNYDLTQASTSFWKSWNTDE